MFHRRRALALLILLPGSALAAPAVAADQVLRIGFHSDGTLILASTRGGLQERLKPLADTVAAAIQVPTPVIATALSRQSFGVGPITPGVAKDQQAIADTVEALGLLPRPVNIAAALPAPAR